MFVAAGDGTEWRLNNAASGRGETPRLGGLFEIADFTAQVERQRLGCESGNCHDPHSSLAHVREIFFLAGLGV